MRTILAICLFSATASFALGVTLPLVEIERLNEEFRRRIKTQTVLPNAETAPMLFWALLASGQIVMRKVDGWETLDQPLAAKTVDLAA